MNKSAIKLLVSGAIGALLMYLLDPDRGSARRTALGDRTMHAVRLAWRWTRISSTDVLNRMQGVVAEVGPRIVWTRPSDPVLVERMRSEMGHVIRHPHKVAVTAEAGHVRLSGVVVNDEREALLTAIGRVPGVLGVQDSLVERNSLDLALGSISWPAASNAS